MQQMHARRRKALLEAVPQERENRLVGRKFPRASRSTLVRRRRTGSCIQEKSTLNFPLEPADGAEANPTGRLLREQSLKTVDQGERAENNRALALNTTKKGNKKRPEKSKRCTDKGREGVGRGEQSQKRLFSLRRKILTSILIRGERQDGSQGSEKASFLGNRPRLGEKAGYFHIKKLIEM